MRDYRACVTLTSLKWMLPRRAFRAVLRLLDLALKVDFNNVIRSRDEICQD